MPSRHDPTYTLEVDWSDTSQYDHPESDVSELVLNGSVLYGSNPYSEDRVHVRTADGTISISNSDYRFDPDSSNARLPEEVLRAKHRCRLSMDGVLLWEGLVSPDRRARPSGTEVIQWDLESRHETSLQAADTELLIPEQGTVARIAQIFTNTTGIALDVASQQPAGIVHHTGQWLTFLDDFGRFAGGWVIESHTGRFLFRKFTDTVSLPIKARLGLNFEPLDDSSYISRAGHVRNFASCRSFFWAPVLDSDDTPSEVLLTTRSFLSTGGTRATDLEFKKVARQRVVSWDRFTIKQGDSVATIVEAAGEGTTASATVSVVASTEPVEVTVEAWGKAEERREAAGIDLEITEGGTVETYGRRPLEIPPWFPTSYEGVTTFARPWLLDLSQPPGHVTAVYRGLQRSASNANILANIRAGDAVDFVQVVDGREVTIEALVLQVRVDWGQEVSPRHTFTGVRRRAIPETPLSITVQNISDQSAQALVEVPSPAGETIYLRYEQLSANELELGIGNPLLLGTSNPMVIGGVSGTWVNATPQRATVEELVWVLTRLEHSTDYLVEVDDSADYSDPAVARFTTALEDLRNKLGEVRVNGNAIVGWDTSRDLEFDTTVTFSTVGRKSVTVAAQPLDPTGTVTIDQATQSGVNDDVLEYRITVTNRGVVPRTYLLRVTLDIPIVYGFSTLDSGRDYRWIAASNTHLYAVPEKGPRNSRGRFTQPTRVDAYNIDLKTRDTSADIPLTLFPNDTLGNQRLVRGIHVEGNVLYVLASWSRPLIRAYDLTTKLPVPDTSDITLAIDLSATRSTQELGLYSLTMVGGRWYSLRSAVRGIFDARDILEFGADGGSQKVALSGEGRVPFAEGRRIFDALDSAGGFVYAKDATTVGYLHSRDLGTEAGGGFLELAGSVSPLPVSAETTHTRSVLTSAPNNNSVDAYRSTEDADVLWILDDADNRIYAYRISTGALLP